MSADRRKLIVVSNRGPASFSRGADGVRTARRGGGGLVTALRSLVSHHDVTWVASAITAEDHVVAREGPLEETALDGSSYRLRLVAHDPHAYDWYYNVVSNPTLWFLQHYLWDLKVSPGWDQGLHRAWQDGYVLVNRGFADAVLDELEREPGATVFFHDYHLYLAPRMVRDALPDARARALRPHPVGAARLLARAARADPARDPRRPARERRRRLPHDALARSFLRSSRDIVGAKTDNERGLARYRGREVLVTAHPISPDPSEFDELAVRSRACWRRSARSSRTGLRSSSCGSIAAIRPRTSCAASAPSSSTSTRIPRCTGVSACWPCSTRPARTFPSTPSTSVRSSARRAGSTIASSGRAGLAIDLQIADNFHQSVAAYKQYDVLLVNAIFDGLNLVAKEAPLVNTRNGVLVLSENTGAHEELGEWALTVNPFDVAGQAEAIHEALELAEDERARRLAAIREHVREHDLAAWIEAARARQPAVPVTD